MRMIYSYSVYHTVIFLSISHKKERPRAASAAGGRVFIFAYLSDKSVDVGDGGVFRADRLAEAGYKFALLR